MKVTLGNKENIKYQDGSVGSLETLYVCKVLMRTIIKADILAHLSKAQDELL